MILRTPKERFVSSSHAGVWGKMIQSEAAEEALFAAFSQLQHELPQDCPVPQQACDAYQQLIGARKLMDLLSSLHMSQTTPPTTKQKGLDYSAGV